MTRSRNSRKEKTEVGKILAKLRIDNDQLQSDMAKRLGVSSSYLSLIERGCRRLRWTVAGKIVSEYGLKGDAADALFRAADRRKKAARQAPKEE